MHATHVEDLIVGGVQLADEARGQVITLLILLAEEQELDITHLVLSKVVGVLDVLTILLGSLSALVVAVILLSQLTLHQCLVGCLDIEFFKTLNSHGRIDVEVGVSILDVSLDIIRVVGESHLIESCGFAPNALVGLHVAREDVTVGIGHVPLLGILDAFLDVLGIGGWIGGIVSACNLNLQFRIFLAHLASLLE